VTLEYRLLSLVASLSINRAAELARQRIALNVAMRYAAAWVQVRLTRTTADAASGYDPKIIHQCVLGPTPGTKK